MSEEWRDILVVGEPAGEEPGAPSFEVLGTARGLADRLGARVLCAWPGDEEHGQSLVHRGADELILLQGSEARSSPAARGQPLGVHEPEPRALKATLHQLVQERRPEMLLLPGTPLGQELAGRLAAALGAGVMAGCVDFDLHEDARLLVGKRQVLGGSVLESVTVPRARPQIATLRPGAARAPWPDDSRAARVSRVPMRPAPAGRQERLGEEARGPQAWRGSERLVVGGALLDADDFAALHGLAGKLGAAWAATRLACEAGLAPPECALRPWDRFAAPLLCIAAGIEDPYEFALSVPRPRRLVLLGQGPLERMAEQVVPGPAGPNLRALAERL